MLLNFYPDMSEIQVCDYSNESYWAVLSCGTDYLIRLYKVVLAFKSVDETLVCDHSNESYCAILPCDAFVMLYKVVLNFKCVAETLVCDHSNESYGAVLKNGSNCCCWKWNLRIWPLVLHFASWTSDQSGNDEFLLARWNGQKNSGTEEQVDFITSARANQGVVTA